MDRGHEVVGLDSGFHRVGWLHNAVPRAPSWVNRDVRRITPDDVAGYDAVVHLGELSNDPLGQIDPTMTYRINHEGSVRLAGLARDAGVERFVYMSSCSVYGAAGEGFSTEESPTEPLTAYAKCKVLVERDVSKLADETSARYSCGTPRHTALRLGCASTSSSTISRAHMDRRHHPDDERRPPMAPIRPCPRHQSGHSLRARRPAARRPQRDLQRGGQRAEPPGPPDRRDHRGNVPRLLHGLRRQRRRPAELPRRFREDPPNDCRRSGLDGMSGPGRNSSSRSSARST